MSAVIFTNLILSLSDSLTLKNVIEIKIVVLDTSAMKICTKNCVVDRNGGHFDFRLYKTFFQYANLAPGCFLPAFFHISAGLTYSPKVNIYKATHRESEVNLSLCYQTLMIYY